MGSGGVERDFSFVKEEINNLKDIPRDFNEKLYKKLGISNTVIAYWREIDYKPAYYILFLLLQAYRYKLLYKEYRKLFDCIVEKVYDENEKLGTAVRDFYNLEQQGYDWFITSTKEYVYILSYSYEDGSGDNLICSCDYEQVQKRMKEEIESDDKDVTYRVERYPVIYSDTGEFNGIDVADIQGYLDFDTEGNIISVENIYRYSYDPMGLLELTNPYIFIPHPFKKGDIISYQVLDETLYGIVTHPCDEQTMSEPLTRGVELDGSDYQIRIELPYERHTDGEIVFDHNHLCPLYLEKYTEEIQELKQKDILSILAIAQEIITGKSGCITDLFYFMGR